MPRKSPTIAVNRRALVARVERALAKQDRELHVDRRANKLRLYLVDTSKQSVVDTDVDLMKCNPGRLFRWPVVSPVNASRLPSRAEPRASLGVGVVG
jgi:hypothetical protein